MQPVLLVFRRGLEPPAARVVESGMAIDPAHPPLGRYIGVIDDGLPEPANEADHFEICPGCGQAIDCRDLGEVMHHMDDGHSPMERHRA